MTERISLEGKVAVVTGAGRGLGRAYVELLAERSARVVVNDLGTNVSGFGKDSGIAEEVADLIRARGGEAIANDSDVSTPQGGSDLIAMTIQHFGRIDLLVNNAGICGSQPFDDATLEDFEQYWRVHLGGPVNTVKAAWPHMVAQRTNNVVDLLCRLPCQLLDGLQRKQRPSRILVVAQPCRAGAHGDDADGVASGMAEIATDARALLGSGEQSFSLRMPLSALGAFSECGYLLSQQARALACEPGDGPADDRVLELDSRKA